MAGPKQFSAVEFCQKPFDFVIIGGGTAGLAVAARLAENPNVVVGVLEAGGTAFGEELIDVPAYYARALGGQHDWRFETAPQPGLGGRTIPWPRGRVLGGTSALNFMTWVRASREDYDAWEALGNPGWGWDSLLPFFQKSETFHAPSDGLRQKYNVTHDPTVFGKDGPIQISYNEEYSASHALWHETLNKLGVQTNSAHHAGSNVGVWTNINTVDPRTAARCYSTSYVDALGQGGNLHILTGATVKNVVLENQGSTCVATGVRFSCNGQEYVASASREIVVAGGSVQSPQILEQSGIGNPEVLKAAAIPVAVASPKVGENLQDHIMLVTVFEVDPSLANPDDLKSDADVANAAAEQYQRDKTGALTILPCSICYVPLKHAVSGDALSSLHSKAASASTVEAYGREKTDILKKRLDGDTNVGQIEYIFDFGNWSPSFKGEDGKKYGTMLQILQHPFSVGSVHVAPKDEDQNKPVINPGYYHGEHGRLDVEVMKECSKFLDKIVTTEPLSNVIRGPAFPSPGTIEDEKKMEDWIIDQTVVDWHPVGTCGMGGHGGIEAGVVDERLRVYGVKGLRVTDASVMPLQISAHLQATVYAIAEKAAHMILEDME